MSFLNCPICSGSLHIKEFKVKGTPLPEGFLYCHSSKPTHFIGLLEHIAHKQENPLTLWGYTFLEKYIVRTWGFRYREWENIDLHKSVVYSRPKDNDPIKQYKKFYMSAQFNREKLFYIDIEVPFHLLEEYIQNHELIK